MSMPSIIILTDSTVQFTLPSFNGRNLVKVLPLNVELRGVLHEGGKSLKPGEMPVSASDELHPRLLPPSIEQMTSFLLQEDSNQPYDQVLGIFLSSSMSSMVTRALEVQKLFSGRVNMQVVDSLTTSAGLGILVQAAAESLAKGASLSETERLVRSLIPHIYAVVCTPGLTYLHYSGFLDRAQACAGELLGLYPIFSIEEGNLTPLEKVRNHRQVLDFFQEFLEEFGQLQHIAFLQSATGNNPQDGRILKDHAQDHFLRTPFSEHTVNQAVATLFGPNTLGLFVVEPGLKKSY
jgi:DegV family protein with EDD domain